jgi:uncharacterized protein (TIGR03435 family)
MMRFRRLIPILAVTAACAQTFDVASVKALAGATHGGPDKVTADGVDFSGSSLGFLVRWAYGLHPNQNYETAGPGWIEPGLGCVWFQVVAKADHPVPVAELKLMMRALLADRLKLAVHRETREMPVYLLKVGKDGSKLHASKTESDGDVQFNGDDMKFQGVTMQRLVEQLGQFVTGLLLDETGLQVRYDFAIDLMQYRDYAVPGPGGRSDWSGVANRALQDIGLKLEPARRQVEVLVIDHAEKTPVEN